MLPGYYTYPATQTPLSISPDTISACNNSLELGYENEQNSVLDVTGFTEQRCQDGDASDVMGKLEGAKYFRIENPNTMQFYDAEYRPVVALRKEAEWKATDPAQGATDGQGETGTQAREGEAPQEAATTEAQPTEGQGSTEAPQTTNSPNNGDSSVPADGSQSSGSSN